MEPICVSVCVRGSINEFYLFGECQFHCNCTLCTDRKGKQVGQQCLVISLVHLGVAISVAYKYNIRV